MKQSPQPQKPYVVMYLVHGSVAARYNVAADSQGDAEIRAGQTFWPSHPEFSILGENEGLEIRAELAHA
jgi:hypothetical protein